MNGVIGEFRIGEDLAIALEATSGDPDLVTAISARMKPAKAVANRLALDDAASGIVLQVTPDAQGWTVRLPSASSAALAPGLYGIDARLSFASGVEITERTAFIALTKAALV